MSDVAVQGGAASVGNDVVDLGDPESSSEALHPRFDARVFAAAERAALAVAPEENRERWKRWAAKEAAYKVARKRVPRTIFSPARFVTEFSAGSEDARVLHAADVFHVKFFEHGEAIHAVALPEGAEPRELECAVQELSVSEASSDPEAPRVAVRDLVRGRLAQRLDLDASRIEVRRIERIPSLWIDGRASELDLSLSHHGRFVAFACAWDPVGPSTGLRAALEPDGVTP